jgi:hypothetical protein
MMLDRIHMILCIIVQLCLASEGKFILDMTDLVLRFAEYEPPLQRTK